MRIVFLTPLAALVAFAVALPLGAAVVRERRDGRVRRALGLAAPGRATTFVSTIAAAGLIACLSAAAAQPAVRIAQPLPARTAAQMFFVLDVSRSMGGAAKRAPDRRARGRRVALH